MAMNTNQILSQFQSENNFENTNKSIGKICDMINKDSVYLPYYQRLSAWDNKKKSLLIDSIMKSFWIPPIQLSTQVTRYNAEDGQQRLLSIWDFVNNRFPWLNNNIITYFTEIPDGLESRPDITTMTPQQINRFMTYNFNCVIYKEGVTSELIKEMYCRVNGGKAFDLSAKLATHIDTSFFQVLVKSIFRYNDLLKYNFIALLSLKMENITYLYDFLDITTSTNLKNSSTRDKSVRADVLKLVPMFISLLNKPDLIPLELAVTSVDDKIEYYNRNFTEQDIVTIKNRFIILCQILSAAGFPSNKKTMLRSWTSLLCLICYDISVNNWRPTVGNIDWVRCLQYFEQSVERKEEFYDNILSSDKNIKRTPAGIQKLLTRIRDYKSNYFIFQEDLEFEQYNSDEDDDAINVVLNEDAMNVVSDDDDN